MKRKLLLLLSALLSNSFIMFAESGKDVTALYVTNPNFSYWNGYEGWTTTTGAINSQLNDNMSDGYYLTDYFWENWNQTPFVGKMYQTLHVPNGVYELSISAFSMMDSEGRTSTYDTYAYANTGMTNVGNLDRYTVRTIVTDGILEIGIGMPVFKQDWVAIDNVKLTYFEESYDLYFEVLNELADFAADIPTLGTLQEAAMNTLDSITTEIWGEVSDDITSLVVAYEKVSDALAVAMHSYSNYAQLHSAYCKLGVAIKNCVNVSLRADAMALCNEAEMAYQELKLGNAEVESLIEGIEKMCVMLKVPDVSDASDENPVDVTGFINNPKYEEYNSDWSGNGWLMNLDYHNVEFYNENFYYYQTLTGLPDGMYKVEMQGFYRPGTTLGAYNLYAKDDKTKFYAKLFAETSEVKHSTYLQSIISEASSYMLSGDDVRLSNGKYIPNTMGGACQYFSQDLYKNYIYIYVTGGTLTIGLEKNQLIVDDWTIFTNWSLTYYGENSEHVSGDASGKYTIKYTVDGTVVARQDVAPGMSIPPLDVAPKKEGYTFIDWEGVPDTMPFNDVTVSGTFSVNIYKVYYYVGEELVHTAEIAYGEAIPEYIYEPTEEGDVFEGWVGDTYETMPAHDVTYVANITNGIDAMSTDNGQQSTVIYDLMGRKVINSENLKGGIYIVNGRKVVIR